MEKPLWFVGTWEIFPATRQEGSCPSGSPRGGKETSGCRRDLRLPAGGAGVWGAGGNKGVDAAVQGGVGKRRSWRNRKAALLGAGPAVQDWQVLCLPADLRTRFWWPGKRQVSPFRCWGPAGFSVMGLGLHLQSGLEQDSSPGVDMRSWASRVPEGRHQSDGHACFPPAGDIGIRFRESRIYGFPQGSHRATTYHMVKLIWRESPGIWKAGFLRWTAGTQGALGMNNTIWDFSCLSGGKNTPQVSFGRAIQDATTRQRRIPHLSLRRQTESSGVGGTRASLSVEGVIKELLDP